MALGWLNTGTALKGQEPESFHIEFHLITAMQALVKQQPTV